MTDANLRPAIEDHVDASRSHLRTDAAQSYRQVGKTFQSHEWVDHGSYEFVRGDVTSNPAESHFSQLKRSLDGTHHHVSPEHLHRYLAEFDYRYNTRKLSDSARLERMMNQTAGRRLRYKPLTERD